MLIDPKTGSITLLETLQINPGDTVDSVSSLALTDNQDLRDMQNGWKWLTVKNLLVHGQYYILSFGFQADALKQIELIVSKDRFDLTAGWDTWSEASERKRLTDLRIWVTNELGREGAFDWGNVQATYDRKSGSSSIMIHYK